MPPMRIAIAGCGYVADFYMETFQNYPDIEVVAAADKDPERAQQFSDFYGIPTFTSIDAMLNEVDFELAVNLTNPREHYPVSCACLEAGRNVYSEKPLAMTFEDASRLVDLARWQGLTISGAPCNLLGAATRRAAQAVADAEIGRVRAVLAEMSDGSVRAMDYKNWRSASGAPWPFADEFELGSTIEHAGYCLAPLISILGPVAQVHGFSALCYPDKLEGAPSEGIGGDFTVSNLEFRSGVVARVNCDLVVSHSDRSLHIIGDDGTITIEDVWAYDAPVYLRQLDRGRRSVPGKALRRARKGADRVAERVFPGRHWHGRRLRQPSERYALTEHARMDFARGVAMQARAIREGREPEISADFVLHVTEVALAMQYPERFGARYEVRSSFDHAVAIGAAA